MCYACVSINSRWMSTVNCPLVCFWLLSIQHCLYPITLISSAPCKTWFYWCSSRVTAKPNPPLILAPHYMDMGAKLSCWDECQEWTSGNQPSWTCLVSTCEVTFSPAILNLLLLYLASGSPPPTATEEQKDSKTCLSGQRAETEVPIKCHVKHQANDVYKQF